MIPPYFKLILKSALESISAPTKNMFLIRRILRLEEPTHALTYPPRGVQNKLAHVLSSTYQFPSVSVLVVKIVIGIIGIRNPPSMILQVKAWHNKIELKYSRPFACPYVMSLHQIASTKPASLRLVPSSSVFCTEFTSLRTKCLMAPTLFSLAASRMS